MGLANNPKDMSNPTHTLILEELRIKVELQIKAVQHIVSKASILLAFLGAQTAFAALLYQLEVINTISLIIFTFWVVLAVRRALYTTLSKQMAYYPDVDRLIGMLDKKEDEVMQKIILAYHKAYSHNEQILNKYADKVDSATFDVVYTFVLLLLLMVGSRDGHANIFHNVVLLVKALFSSILSFLSFGFN